MKNLPTFKELESNKIFEDEGQHDCCDFFSKLFQSRDIIHLCHLATTSYAAHVALGGYYEGIVGLVDGLVESYQGVYGLQKIDIPITVVCEPIGYLKNLYSYIMQSKEVLFKESFYLNQIDTILELLASTLYKLQFLK